MPAKLEIAGKRFGRWVVLKKHNTIPPTKEGTALLWECRCDCGKERSVSGSRLVRGRSLSCGCLQKEKASADNTKNISGERFGKLVVIENSGRDSNGGLMWKCKCDCGKIILTKGASVRSGATKSCGCSRISKTQNPAFNAYYSEVKCSARARGLEFLLTKEELMELASKRCHYCGADPTERLIRNGHHRILRNGIDRKNNIEGYTIKNSLPCCWTCNSRKQAMSYNEFISWIERVSSNIKRGDYVR